MKSKHHRKIGMAL